MSRGKSKVLVLTSVFLMFIALYDLRGQTYRFRNWGPEIGSFDPYIYSISQDNNGFLWLGTSSGIFKFDGFDFYRIPYPDSSDNRVASVIFRDSKSRLWIGCNDGKLYHSDGRELISLPDSGISGVVEISEDSAGKIWVIPQEKKILKFDPEKQYEISTFDVPAEISMTSGCLTDNGELFLGTPLNLLYCTLGKDSVKIIEAVKGIEYTTIQEIVRPWKDDRYLVGTDGSGLFSLTLKEKQAKVQRLIGAEKFEGLSVRNIFTDKDGFTWILHSQGVVKLKISDRSSIDGKTEIYDLSSGLPIEDVRAIAQDDEENIWLGFYGAGLSMFTSRSFMYYQVSEDPEQKNIIYINGKDNRYLLGTPGGFYYFNISDGKKERFNNLAAFAGGNEVTCYFQDEMGLWFGTMGRGLWLRDNTGSVRSFFRSGNIGADKIFNINSDRNSVWLSTLSGIIVIDKRSGKMTRNLQMVPEKKNEIRLPHNSIKQVFFTKDGKVLPATELDRLYLIDPDDGLTVGKALMAGTTKNKVQAYAENAYGGIFAATYGNGLFYLSGDTVYNISTANGLFSNYCYSILYSSSGSVWTGHQRGFSRFDPSTGTTKAFSTDFARSGDCNAGALFEDEKGKILIGTTEGLIVFDRSMERKASYIPKNNITRVTINNIVQPLKNDYYLPYKNYTVKIEYVGISLSEPEKVAYTTRLDGVNDDWSSLTYSRSAEYTLRDGKYKFNLLSYNTDGLTQEEQLSFNIHIKKPLWRTWWFILLMIGAGGVVVSIIIREREKAHKKINDYLEKELAERTSLVIKQKDEIQLQNIEITDSINYAKRIQSSILPDINKLKETFADAFIFFHPRDIVSGDFYWFDKISDEKFIVVCADSTGHGVPGAFMSMIGSTLLQDIVSRKGITRPSDILTLLDKQIFSTLNQNVDVGVSNDGMDMVVCEINTKTRHVKFASAMRPVIIVMGGESYYIKGNRCSVGGESVIEKYFDDQEYYLGENDTLYMFSDGLPDQFGGVDGKKMKIARLKKLIEDIAPLPMNEQKEAIADFFFEWKSDYEQVDDILMMGIRL